MRGRRPKAKPPVVTRDDTPVGLAAQRLQRECEIIRCNDAGVPSPGGKFWRVAGRVRDDAWVLARAERLRSFHTHKGAIA